MDFNNVSDLLEGMRSYYDSHDIHKSDVSSYDAFKLNDNPEPRLKALVDKDRYGEYLGQVLKRWTDPYDPMHMSDITVYLMPDDRVAGVVNHIGGMMGVYELFEYHDGYYTGAEYSITGNMESHNKFTYYILNDEGKVTKMLSIYGGMISYNSDMQLITRMLLDYEGDNTILKSSEELRYKRTADGFKLFDEQDVLTKKDNAEREERVIDDQKALYKTLKKRVKTCSTLEDVVEVFFEVISEAEYNPEEEITYTAGTSQIAALLGYNESMFNLMRWTTAEDDEYYQLQVDVEFDIKDEQIPYDNMNDANDVEGMKDRVLDSASFKALSGRKIKKIKVDLVET